MKKATKVILALGLMLSLGSSVFPLKAVAGNANILVITGSATQTAGASQNLTITAWDTVGVDSIATNYNGVKSLRFLGANASPDNVKPTITDNAGVATQFNTLMPITFVNGVATVSGSSNGLMRLYKVETAQITVTDGTLQSNTFTVNVSPGALGKFQVIIATPQKNAVAFTGADTVKALDDYGNIVTTFDASTNPVTLSTIGLTGRLSGIGAADSVLNSAADFASGIANLAGRLKFTGLVGTGKIRATSSVGGKTGTSADVVIQAGDAKRFIVTGSATQVAGSINGLTITAKDTSGNTATSYDGIRTVIFSGANTSPAPESNQPTVADRTGSSKNFGVATDLNFSLGVATTSGSTNGAMTLYKTETATISVADGAITSSGTNNLTVTVTPGNLGRFSVVLTSPQTNGVTFTGLNTITAIDQWGNNKTDFSAATNNVTVTTTFSGTVSGLGSGGTNVLNQAGDFVNGVADLTGKLKYTGTASGAQGTFTATAAGKTGTSNSIDMSVGSAKRIVITGSANQTAGSAQSLTITLKDTSGNTVTTFSGNKSLTFSGASSIGGNTPTVTSITGAAVSFGSATTIAFSNGVSSSSLPGFNGAMSLYRAETDTISATDGTISSTGSDKLIVTVAPDALAKFEFVLSSPQTNGIAFTGTNTLTAQDKYGNTVTSFNASGDAVTINANGPLSGTVSGLGASVNNVLNQAGDFVQGVASLTGKMKYTGGVGTGTFAANSSTSKTGTSGSVTIVAGGATRLVIDGLSTQTAGGSQNLTITAKDGSGNVVTAYSGVKTLTFSGADSLGGRFPTIKDRNGTATNFGSPTELNFTSGVASVSSGANGVMTLYRAQSAIISVTDGTISSSGADRLSVTVSPGSLGKFLVVLSTPQKNGVAFSGTNTVTARDDYDNPITTFNAASTPVTISTTLTGTITGLGGAGNNRLNRTSDFVSGVADLTGKLTFTGTVGSGTFTATASGKTGTSGIVQMNSGGASRLVISGFTTGTAGVAQNLTITAKDASGNVDVDYAGIKNLIFSGADSIAGNFPVIADRNGSSVRFGSTTEINFVAGVSTVAGGANGAMTLFRAQTATISVTDGTIGSSGADRLSVVVAPGPLGRFDFQLESSQRSGISFVGVNRLTAQDSYRNTITAFDASSTNVTISSTLIGRTTGLGASGDSVLNRYSDFVSGVADLTALGMKFTGVVGSGTFTATGGGRSGTSGTVVLLAGEPNRLVLSGSNTQTAGSKQNLTITARDASDNVAASYSGDKQIIFSGANPSTNPSKQPTVTNINGTETPFGVPTVLTFNGGIAAVNGEANGALRLYKAEDAVISVTDGVLSTSGGDRLSVKVTPGTFGQFALAITSPQINGNAFTGLNTLTAQDDWGNTDSSFDASVNNVTLTSSLTGTITGLGSLKNNVLNRKADFVIGVANLTQLGMKFKGTAGTGTFTATSAVGAKSGTSQTITIQNPVPVLSTVLPAKASRSDTVSVVLTGQNFISGVSSMDFGTGIAVSKVSVDTLGQLKATLVIDQTAALGPRNISVTNAAPGGGTSTLTSGFTVENVPRIDNLSPAVGIRNQTLDVTVTGANFAEGVSTPGIVGAGITPNSWKVNSSTSITFNITVTLAAADGVRQINVTNIGQYGGVSNSKGFTVGNNPSPKITSVTPATATRLQTVDLTVKGTNFYSGITTATLGAGIAVKSFVIDSTTQLRMTVTVSDTAATGARPIVIVNASPGGGRDSLITGFTVTNPAPTLTGISAQNGARLQTMDITLTGSRFIRSDSLVNMGKNIVVKSLVVDSTHTQVRVTIAIDSSAALGVRDVSVKNLAPGGGKDTLKAAFTVNNPVPTITSLSRDSVDIQTSPMALTVVGTNFVPGSILRMGTDSLAITLFTQTQIMAIVPITSLDTARALGVTVFNPAPGGGTSNVRTFTVRNPVPTLTAPLSPAGATRLQRLPVTFTGTNFVPGFTSVNFGTSDITVDSVRVVSPTSLVAWIVVAGNATINQPRDVSVSNPPPGGGTSNTKPFTVGDNPAPTIANITPTAGNRLRTLDVLVQGTNFIPSVTSVDFGTGITLNKTTINSSTQLTANITIPVTAATGARTVSVINAAPGGGTATRPNGFTVNNPPPTLTRVSPSNGQQLQTLNIVFYGSGFINSVTSVNMGFGVNIKSLTVVSDSQMTANITITTDAEPGARDIYVTNLGPVGGEATAVLSNAFVIGNNPKPSITSIAPASVKRLETVNLTVRGGNFISAVTSVDLGAGIVVNTTTVDSAKQMTVNATVLPTAPTGPRTVFVINAAPGGGRDSILSGLTVVNPVPTLISLTPQVVTRGQTLNVVLRGTNFISSTTTVNFGSDVNINSTTVDSVSRITVNVTIGSAAPLGTRNVTVTNATPGGGTTAALPFQITIASPPTPVQVSPTDGQLYLPLTLTLRWDSSAGASVYHVQVARNAQFLAGTLDVDDSTLTTRSRLIGSPTQLINGTLYYWRLRAGNAGGWSTWTSPGWSFKPFYPGTFELVHNYAFPAYNAPGDYAATDYRLIGLPGTSTALISALLGGTQGTDWQLYSDNGSSTEPYFTAYDGTSTFIPSVGRAYWLIHKGEWKLSASVSSEPLDATGAVLLPVHRGWNMITNPFTTSVLWSDVQKVNGTAASGNIWTYQGGFSASTSLEPYIGYYFYSDSGRTLRIPYAATTRVLKSNVVLPELSWKIDIELRGDGFIDRSTTIGVAEKASEGLDQFDQRKPRAPGEATTISMLRRDLDPEFSSFAADIRAPFEELAKWPFEIRTKARKQMSLIFDKPADVPEEYVVYLVDQVRAARMNLREKTEYAFKPVTDVSSFAVLAGKASAVEQELNNLLPREFSLGNNFPNPFNPTTTIPIAVPFTSQVTLKVYNILGEEVRTLQDGILEAGRHWLTWDGKNGAGNGVASGVYIARMTTGSGAKFIGKMLLVK